MVTTVIATKSLRYVLKLTQPIPVLYLSTGCSSQTITGGITVNPMGSCGKLY
jgi:hypothetical protein